MEAIRRNSTWLDVDTGQNSENDSDRDLFATTNEAFGGKTRAP
jgi:hypothetical protein